MNTCQQLIPWNNICLLTLEKIIGLVWIGQERGRQLLKVCHRRPISNNGLVTLVLNIFSLAAVDRVRSEHYFWKYIVILQPVIVKNQFSLAIDRELQKGQLTTSSNY